ncbi:MAG: class I SAM-dependent methyltransferase [Rhodobacteraceae bacterium]|nr:class I SAM-dependent methyltransferase [Paracoccaceae bacterium]
MAEPNPTLEKLTAILASASARRVGDIGCGPGALAAALAERGFDVVGIDPQADQITVARETCPRARFLVGTAEALPLPDASLDAAIFLNSLHHVPEVAMGAALAEALRTLAPGGDLIVIEPLAEGSFFEAMRPIDDETEIRAAALRALDVLKNQGTCELLREERYDRANKLASLDEYLDFLVRADPARATVIAAQRKVASDSFLRHAELRDGVYRLIQPLALWHFRTRPSPAL